MMAAPVPGPVTPIGRLLIATEAARLGTALDRLYAASGGSFGDVVEQVQFCLRALAARIQAEGGSTDGWVP